MTKPLCKHDATNVVAEIPGRGIILGAATDAPPAQNQAFAPGALFMQFAVGAGYLYQKDGSTGWWNNLSLLKHRTVGHAGQRNTSNIAWDGADGPSPDPRGNYSIDIQTFRAFSSNVPIATRFNPTRAAEGGICIGQNNAAGDWCTAIGYSNDSCYEAAFGCGWYTHAYTSGMFAYSSGCFVRPGDSQWTITVLKVQTTDATPTEVTTGAYLPLSPKTRILWGTGKKTYDCFIRITGRRTNSADCASFWRRCLVTQEGTTGGQVVGTIQTIGTDIKTDGTWGDPAIDITNAAPHDAWRIRVRVTGKAATTIRWTVIIEALEVADS